MSSTRAAGCAPLAAGAVAGAALAGTEAAVGGTEAAVGGTEAATAGTAAAMVGDGALPGSGSPAACGAWDGCDAGTAGRLSRLRHGVVGLLLQVLQDRVLLRQLFVQIIERLLERLHAPLERIGDRRVGRRMRRCGGRRLRRRGGRSLRRLGRGCLARGEPACGCGPAVEPPCRHLSANLALRIRGIDGRHRVFRRNGEHGADVHDVDVAPEGMRVGAEHGNHHALRAGLGGRAGAAHDGAQGFARRHRMTGRGALIVRGSGARRGVIGGASGVGSLGRAVDGHGFDGGLRRLGARRRFLSDGGEIGAGRIGYARCRRFVGRGGGGRGGLRRRESGRVEQQRILANQFAIAPTQVHQEADHGVGEGLARSNVQDRPSGSVQSHLERGGGEKRRAVSGVVQEHVAIRHLGRERGEFVAGRAHDVDLCGKGFVERGVHANVAQAERPGRSGQRHGQG